MDTKHLQSFLAVARLLHFGKAALQLNFSQSTISEHVRILEESLQVKLFERLGKKVILTKEGVMLLPMAEQLVENTNKIESTFRSQEKVSGKLIIGAAESLCVFWLPPLLKEYKCRYPDVQIIIKMANCLEFRQWLQQNTVDIAFSLHDEYDNPWINQTHLFRGNTIFIASPDHLLTQKSRIDFEDLIEEILILPEAGCGYRTDLETLLQDNQIDVAGVMELSSLEAIKQCVKNNLGIALLPRIAVEEELKRGDLIKLDWAGPSIPINAKMIFHRDKWLSPPLATLINLISTQL